MISTSIFSNKDRFWSKILIKSLTQIKQNIYLLKINWKSWKQLIQVILEAKIILKKMELFSTLADRQIF